MDCGLSFLREALPAAETKDRSRRGFGWCFLFPLRCYSMSLGLKGHILEMIKCWSLRDYDKAHFNLLM